MFVQNICYSHRGCSPVTIRLLRNITGKMRCHSPRRHCSFNPHHCRHASRQVASEVGGRSTHSAPPVLNPTNEAATSPRSERPQGRESQPPAPLNRGHHGNRGCHPYHKKHGHHEHGGHFKRHGHHGHRGGHHKGHHGHGSHQCSEGSCFVTCA